MALDQVKKGGPYPKSEQRKRRDEVYKLHFDYGYSARKIAEFLKVNRGTINRDIDYCYANTAIECEEFDLKLSVMKEVERLEIQRTRLRKLLDNTESFNEKDRIEKFIFNITIQIANIKTKLVGTRKNVYSNAANVINRWYKQEKSKTRVISSNELLDTSADAREKIYKILVEDWKYSW